MIAGERKCEVALENSSDREKSSTMLCSTVVLVSGKL
jgi:hypothetical protein